MSGTVSHTDNVTKIWLRGLLGFAPTGLEWRETQATHTGGRLSTKMDRGGDEWSQPVGARSASEHLRIRNLCLRIKDEAGLFAGALGLELGGYGEHSNSPPVKTTLT